jgi:outer membrane immunogenic protein
MKKLLIGSTALAVMIAGPAMAADMPLKAPAPVVSYYDWSGVYLGASVGWIKSSYDWAYTNPAPATCCKPFSGSVTDAIIDGHLGAQFQWGWLVLGVEASANRIFTGTKLNQVGCVAPNSLTTACQIQPRDIRTVGGRLGFAWQEWMIYGTGGGAWTSVQTNLFFPGANGPTVFSSDDKTNANYRGWYAGGGFEYVMYKGNFVDVIVGAEYQHIDFGSETHFSTFDGFFPCPPGVNCRRVTAKEDIARARISIKTQGWKFIAQ